MFGIIRESGGRNAHPSVNCPSFYNNARSVDDANSAPEIVSAVLSVEDTTSSITPKSIDELPSQGRLEAEDSVA
ncbi:hypothetical protein HPB50_019742 [Hyalomma asiaticum]|uniref:Uncharacterized protein n=1 Tax=Hyalomma asiaticum TaxID=266040 RepID=A0ACB7TNF7_HYAAI|nr:hypothetical protein HPB50_019742 [Hyalomma asiaticum]